MWAVKEVDLCAAPAGAAGAAGASRATEPRRYRTAPEIHDLLAPHGAVESAELDVTAGYRDFEEFWQAMDRRVGPAGHWLASLDPQPPQPAHAGLFPALGRPPGPVPLHSRRLAP